MERAERIGLGVATVGHALLFGILSLGLVTRAKLPPPRNEPIDVVLVDAIGLRSASPDAAQEAPAPSEAPTIAKPEEAIAPEPAPPEPEPAPAPAPTPKPAPPKPAPPKPAPKPEPKPTPRPEPKPAQKPDPKPAPKPVPKPAPTPKPAPRPAPPKPAPSKPAPAKAAEAKTSVPDKAAAAPAKTKATDAGDARDRRRPDRDGGGAPSKTAKPAGGKTGEKPAKPAGSRLGPDFLKGITPEKTATGKSAKPAAAVSAVAMQGLAGAIKRQVEPCYELGSLAGTPAMSIVTTLRLRFNKDGSTATAPVVTEHSGVNGGNQSYVRQIDDIARRAVLRCAPLKLPADLYEGGWEDIELRFIPGQMG